MECAVDIGGVAYDVPLIEDDCWRGHGGALLRVDGGGVPSQLASFVHESFRGLALNPRFACLGGQAAVRQNAYRFGLYRAMGCERSSAALARGLASFAEDPDLQARPFTAFVASFVSPAGDEESFERLLWTTLQQLHDRDRGPWAPERHSDPRDPEFAFSFGGIGLFVVGLHAASSRFARRFGWPTLVFNPHRQFDRLRATGQFARFRDLIRGRDAAVQGSANPMLSDFGEISEARQYSGRAVGSQWECPFHARDQSHYGGES
jgi:FPC/CPF motif-containing protein YcgG